MALQTQGLLTFVKKHPVGVGCVLLAAVLGVATSFRSGDLDDLRTELDEVSREGARLQNNLRYAARLDEHTATVQQAVASIDAHVIDPDALATNLQYFYRLESELQLKLLDLRQGTMEGPAKGASYGPVGYTVTVEGNYRQLLEFIRSLESGALYVRFLSANLSPNRAPGQVAAGGGEPSIVLSLTLQVLGRP